MKMLIQWLGWGVLFLVLYFAAFLGYGTLTDWVPDPQNDLEAIGPKSTKTRITDSTLTFLSWNVGYGGLGSEEAFFYDQGGFFWTKPGTARVPRERVMRYVNGMHSTLRDVAADLYFLQEVDTSSRRSWYTNQLDTMHRTIPDYSAFFAMNYKNERVPIPVFQPWDHYGYVRGGLVSFSRVHPEASTRFQLPGELEWPTRLFALDRCVLRQTFTTSWGKQLVVYNVHLSAYDKGGAAKKEQMDWLKEKIEEDYAAGHYVVVGGDWNQVPPGVDYGSFSPERRDEFFQMEIPDDFVSADWTWAYDPATPTNRKSREVYRGDESILALIDFYLVSPNVSVDTVKGVEQDFAFSDHQPVWMRVRLK